MACGYLPHQTLHCSWLLLWELLQQQQLELLLVALSLQLQPLLLLQLSAEL
jgi:hypothetical protein